VPGPDDAWPHLREHQRETRAAKLHGRPLASPCGPQSGARTTANLSWTGHEQDRHAGSPLAREVALFYNYYNSPPEVT
jgi:hypothetical protein